MALFDATKGWGGGVLIGIGAAIAAPVIIPATAAVVRPIAKGLIWGVLAAADKLKETVAETREQMNDLVAEVRAEYDNGAGTTGKHKSRSLSA